MNRELVANAYSSLSITSRGLLSVHSSTPVGRAVALMASWFPLPAFGFGPGKGAEV